MYPYKAALGANWGLNSILMRYVIRLRRVVVSDRLSY